MAKYYWLKLDKDFFKKYDVKIMKSETNGDKLVLFYLELMCESTSHGGMLRYSPTKPYDNEMLSKIFGYEVSFIESAMETFKNLELVEILEDQTIYMPKVEEAIGCETENAKKMRSYRDKKLQSSNNVTTMLPQCNHNVVTTWSQCPTESESESESELELIKNDKDDKGILAFTKNAKILNKFLSLGYFSLDDKTEMFSIDNWITENLHKYNIEDFKVALGYFIKKIPTLKNVKDPSAYFISSMKTNLKPETVKKRKDKTFQEDETISVHELDNLLEGL